MNAHQANTPPVTAEQPALLHKTMFTARGTSGESFTVTSSKNFHLTIRGLKGSHIVINKWKGPVIYSSKRNHKNGPDFDDEVFLDAGDYVVSLVSRGDLPAEAFIELR
jgi:hypothetical protein